MNANSKDRDDGIRWLCPKCCSSDPVIILKAPKVEVQGQVCKKFKRGNCPHGITGKTEYRGKVCEFAHPKLC